LRAGHAHWNKCILISIHYLYNLNISKLKDVAIKLYNIKRKDDKEIIKRIVTKLYIRQGCLKNS